jgi:hypothetical protein
VKQSPGVLRLRHHFVQDKKAVLPLRQTKDGRLEASVRSSFGNREMCIERIAVINPTAAKSIASALLRC